MSPPPPPPPPLEPRNDESGLTTLEWLLIVAAVAGLAALAVVLVQNVVNDTAEQISGSNARQTAALIAAKEVMDDARRDHGLQPNQARTWADWENFYNEKCAIIGITYADAGIEIIPGFKVVDRNNTLTFFLKSGQELKEAPSDHQMAGKLIPYQNGQPLKLTQFATPEFLQKSDGFNTKVEKKRIVPKVSGSPTEEAPAINEDPAVSGTAIAHCQVVL